MSKKNKNSSASPEGARRATDGDAGAVRERGRFSSRRKAEAVLRLLRGEDLDRVSRELGVTGETFLAGAQGSLKSRPEGDRDEEIRRLRAKVGEITMANELLLERCYALEDHRPLPWKRSRP